MSTERVAVITGASRGIGAATAVCLGARGFRVVLNYLSRVDKANEVAEAVRRAGGDAIAVGGDVRDPGRAAALVDAAVERFGRLDALVCNAATPVTFTGFDDLDFAVFTEKITDELAAAFHVTRAAAAAMSRGGSVVFVSSDLARRAELPAAVAHGTAKAALEAFARYLATTYGPRGITVNVVAPGYVRTEASAPNADPAIVQSIVDRTPLGRVADADDIARVLAAVVADTGDFLTGAHIPVTGGAHAAH